MWASGRPFGRVAFCVHGRCFDARVEPASPLEQDLGLPLVFCNAISMKVHDAKIEYRCGEIVLFALCNNPQKRNKASSVE